jgi:hypothetical protein
MFLLAEMVKGDEAMRVHLVDRIADDPVQQAFTAVEFWSKQEIITAGPLKR